jgi:hypothetical protein
MCPENLSNLHSTFRVQSGPLFADAKVRAALALIRKNADMRDRLRKFGAPVSIKSNAQVVLFPLRKAGTKRSRPNLLGKELGQFRYRLT